jgi:hypothetical protein
VTLTETRCMFSGEAADTEEHVVPKWMQSRFNLWDQMVVIPNGTPLPYRHVKVPVAAKHNAIFGKIETRISQGIYIPQEVYLWALKIHIGFIFRDATLKFDRRRPDSAMIWNIDDFSSEIAMFQMLYGLWSQGGTINPDPFGSVFILDALTPKPEFDFIHCATSGTILLQLGTKIIFVSVWDQSDGLSTNLLDQWKIYHEPTVAAACEDDRQHVAHAAHHVWACDSAYWLWRQRRGFNMIKTQTSLALVPPAMRSKGRDASESELARFCRTFGLKLERYGGEVSNAYSLLDLSKPQTV